MGVREEHRVIWPLMGMQKGQRQDVEVQGACRRGGPGHPSNQGQLTSQAPTAPPSPVLSEQVCTMWEPRRPR